MSDLPFRGRAARLAQIDIPRIADQIDVGEDELRAFMEVEAAGRGFDSSNRPTMLFEPHVFWRNLSGAKREKAAALGLAYPKWGEKPYPLGSYPRLERAVTIDREAALRASSWGLTQILGENHAAAGYDSAGAMVEAFMDSEAAHLEATVRLLVRMGIDDDLRAHRWQVVARVWNGPGYAKNAYDTKLARAFAKWAKIPDLPWESEKTVERGEERPVLRFGDAGTHVAHLQRLLNAAGAKLAVDADFGPRTEGAVKTFQGRRGLNQDGIVGSKTWRALADVKLP